MDKYDVLVIGGGPGGYVAAIRAAQLGFKAACVDRRPAPGGKGIAYGGTCLNVGCIPSKALLESSHHYEMAREGFAAHGIKTGKVALDLPAMLGRKDAVVKQLTGGIGMLFKKNKIAALEGSARLAKLGPPHEVEIEGAGTVQADHVIIATGSDSRPIPAAPVDNDRIVDNVGALEFDEVPARLCIIGAGVIGLELGSVWRRLGAEVTVLEALPEFLGVADADIAKAAAKVFAKQGLDIKLGCKVTGTKPGRKNVEVTWEEDGAERKDKFDRLIVAVGRVPCTSGLGAEEAGLKLEQGRIAVDAQCRTGIPNLWALGDVVRGPMLAHKAEEEGVMVAELIAGKKTEVHFDAIPWVIYTHPEIAWAGKTERELKESGTPYQAGSFPFAANGRALSVGDATGMVKILAHAETDRVLGVHMFGNAASEMIAEAVMAMEFEGSAEDIALICHAHPTLSEATKEAALAVAKRAIHA